jgi:hypothetical protein
MKTLLVMVLLSISLPDSNDADFLRQALDCIKDPNCLAQWRMEHQAENLLKIAEPIEPNEPKPKAAPWGAVPLEYQLTLMDFSSQWLSEEPEADASICKFDPNIFTISVNNLPSKVSKDQKVIMEFYQAKNNNYVFSFRRQNYNPLDINRDLRVDMHDFAEVSQQWMKKEPKEN